MALQNFSKSQNHPPSQQQGKLSPPQVNRGLLLTGFSLRKPVKMSDLQALCMYNILKRIASRGEDKNIVWPSYPPTLATSLDPLNHVIPSTKVRAECVGWGVNNFDAYFPEMAYFSRYPHSLYSRFFTYSSAKHSKLNFTG